MKLNNKQVKTIIAYVLTSITRGTLRKESPKLEDAFFSDADLEEALEVTFSGEYSGLDNTEWHIRIIDVEKGETVEEHSGRNLPKLLYQFVDEITQASGPPKQILVPTGLGMLQFSRNQAQNFLYLYDENLDELKKKKWKLSLRTDGGLTYQDATANTIEVGEALVLVVLAGTTKVRLELDVEYDVVEVLRKELEPVQ